MRGHRLVRYAAIALAASLCMGLSDAPPPAADPEQTAGTGPAPQAVHRALPRPVTRPWTYQRLEDDTPMARTCSSDEEGRVCLAVACRPDAGLTFEYFGPGDPGAPPGGAVFVSTLAGVKRVDLGWTLLNQPFAKRAPLTVELVELLRIGGRGLYEEGQRRFPFTLDGSAAAIDAVSLRCR